MDSHRSDKLLSRGMLAVVAAQFLSAAADNALLFGALALLRFSGGKKVPAALMRMRADDLLAAVFPHAAACPETLEGDRDIRRQNALKGPRYSGPVRLKRIDRPNRWAAQPSLEITKGCALEIPRRG